MTQRPTPAPFRIGHGFDVHRLGAERPLRLAGVEVPCEAGGLHGHSDADVLAHAIASALLGSVALGDLGTHFPDTDPRYTGVSSLELLSLVVEKVRACGYETVNVDCTVVAQRPRLSPYIEAMRAGIAARLDLGVDRVSIKATTAEGIGSLGRVEGIAAHAVVLVTKRGA